MTDGLIMVFTGEGKGKTTASLGMALRAWGQGFKILLLQFIKSGRAYGELKAIEHLPGFEVMSMGTGFVNYSKEDTQDEMLQHQLAAREAFAAAKKEIVSKKWDMIILDEINYAVNFGFIEEDEVLKLLDLKPPELHLVLTGRHVKDKIVQRADLVTEMTKIKHAYSNGIKAQKGVEF